MLLWIVLSVLSGAAALWVIRPLVRTETGGGTDERGARAAGYRAALEAVSADRDAAIIQPKEADAERAMLARALLAETAPATQAAPVPPCRWLAAAFIGVLVLASLALYLGTGMFEGRPSAIAYDEQAKLYDLAQKLVARAAQAPNDPQAYLWLGRVEATLGHYAAAARAYAKGVALGARDPQTLTAYAETLAQNAGSATPEVLAALDEAIAADPDMIRARIDRAQGRFSAGDYAGAREDWIYLRGKAPPNSQWVEAFSARIKAAQQAMSRPPALSAGQAGSMNADAQSAMIQGMVEGLARRLEGAPRDLQGWLRLIHAYVVLGASDKANSALGSARKAFVDDAQARAALDDAARAIP